MECIDKIIFELQKGAIQVANLLQKRETEYSNNSNKSGDNQLKVDILADKLFSDILKELPIKGFASEEQDEITYIQNTQIRETDAAKSNNFLVAFDPLDGSSLVETNLAIGSIFGIYCDEFCGKNLLASVYFVYGVRLEMVLAKDLKSSHYFYNYSTHSWEFLQIFHLSEKGKLNAPGGTQKHWFKKHKQLIESFFQAGYRLRYSGGMVADLHQILCKGGGIFSYPATIDSPKGKLRNLFEVFPFALIFEYAGGMATNGPVRLLDISTANIHDTTPCFFGTKVEMQEVLRIYKE